MAAEVIARSRDAVPLLLPGHSPHPGLVFERFPRLLERTAGGYALPDGARRDWLLEFIGLAEATPERQKRLKTVHKRLDALVGRGGLRRELRTVSRFVCGLGNPSAAEIGMSFDVSCGVPYLPGSSVKGLARAGARLADKPEAEVAAVLGRGPGDGDDGAGGSVTFLDALPLDWPRFDIDIVTRHHDPEALPSQAVPLETDRPNPVHFLTMKAGQAMVFRLLPAGHAADGTLEAAWDWLAGALDMLGAGAKTAVGYGQMAEP